MAFTLVGWSESQDTSGNLTNVAALADQHVRVSGDDITVPAGASQLIAAYANGATISQAQLVSPSLRRVVNMDLPRLDVAAEPTVPTAINLFLDHPIPLVPDENLNALVAEGAAGAERENVLAWLSDGQIAAVQGPIYTVRVTASQTLVANAWTAAALTFSQNLPVGNYAIVGARFKSTGLLAFRFVFIGGTWRPGAIGFDADGDVDLDVFRMGRLGQWGTFRHNLPPQVEFLSVSADTSEVGYLDLVPLAAA